MRKKDFGNTFNINKPQNYEQKVNKDTETYNSTNEDGSTQQKNMEFTQMYNTYLPELAELAVDNGLARAILDIMSCNMELNNTYIISQKDLAKVFGKDERTIRTAIKVLKDRDFVTIFKHERQNVYFINPRIFCKASPGYKQKLIKVYVKMNELKDYREQHQSLNMSALDNPERLVFKKSFAEENHELDRPSNLTIHKEKQVIEAISNLTDEQVSVILQLNANKTLSDKEIAKIQASSEQRQKAIEASEEYLQSLKKEQELYYKTQELEERLNYYKNPKEESDPVNAFSDLYNPDDPTGIIEMSEQEINPLDYLVDPYKD